MSVQNSLSSNRWNPAHPAHLKNYRFETGSADQVSAAKDEFLKGYYDLAFPLCAERPAHNAEKNKTLFSYLPVIVYNQKNLIPPAVKKIFKMFKITTNINLYNFNIIL